MFKKGDKVILDLHTVYGHLGCTEEDHNKVFRVITFIDDGIEASVVIKPLDTGDMWEYCVDSIMLHPFIQPGEQLLFSFMKGV